MSEFVKYEDIDHIRVIRIDRPEKNAIIYVNPKVKAIEVRGMYGRYISVESLIREYQSPRAGRPGTSYTYGTRETQCFGHLHIPSNFQDDARN